MDIRKGTEADLAALAALEAACFPPEEAASEAVLAERLRVYGNHFWLLTDGNRVISFVDGFCTDQRDLTDEMYADPSLHREQGRWQMIFGVNTHPDFRNQGCAGRLLRQIISESEKTGRQGLVLTCKVPLVDYYSRFGFQDEGVTNQSTHGGAVWHQMRLTFPIRQEEQTTSDLRIILSPAKKMKTDTDSMPVQALPCFVEQAEELRDVFQGMTGAELQALWKCNDKIAALNTERLRSMDFRRSLTPAILAYEGIAYQYMAPGVFTEREFRYVQEHLRILSGMYGILRPMDGVTPYRLEMGAKLSVGKSKDLYGYWGTRLADCLASETGCVINLASKEYSRAVERHLPERVRFVTVVFGEHVAGKTVEKGTLCKMARGEMVRFMAEREIQSPEELLSFDRLGYRFCPEESRPERLTFIKEERG